FQLLIAEQTNVWIGGYHTICWEMGVDKFNFFLDEMILWRNKDIRQKLEWENQHPHNVEY
ncbi:hypothetical protein L208DRAFT_1310206, partial [Tricholoma matsutake]